VALVLPAGALLEPADANAQEGPPVKIAVVDLDRLVAQSTAGQKLQARLEKFQQDTQAEAEALTEKAREIRQRIAEGANSLSENALADLQKQYEDQTVAIRRLRDDKQREGQKIQQEGLREIERQLEPVFIQIRDQGGYDLILNNVPGVVVMAADRVDITQQAIDRFNAGQ
jgi:outer membrane protein